MLQTIAKIKIKILMALNTGLNFFIKKVNLEVIFYLDMIHNTILNL